MKCRSHYITSEVHSKQFSHVSISEWRGGESRKVEFKSVSFALVEIVVKTTKGTESERKM